MCRSQNGAAPQWPFVRALSSRWGGAQARALGHAELPIAVIAHPFGVRTRDEVRVLADGCVDEVVKLATGHNTK